MPFSKKKDKKYLICISLVVHGYFLVKFGAYNQLFTNNRMCNILELGYYELAVATMLHFSWENMQRAKPEGLL